jgi:RNA polymerase sigma-70 factor (ECF subfamily)
MGEDVRNLVELASHGDQDAFASLAAASIDRMFSIAYRILRDVGRAEDAVQSAFLEAWRDLPRLRDHDKFDAWLRRLTVNACYDEARRHRAFGRTVHVVPVEPAEPDQSRVLADRDQLQRAFEKLPADQRAVVVLHHYIGLPLRDVAAQLDIPLGTAKSRLHYAMRGLRAAVEADTRPARAQERIA